MTSYSADKSEAGRIFAAGVHAAMMLLLLAACSAGKDELVTGRHYEGLIATGTSNQQVPLPEGNWILAGTAKYTGIQEVAGILIETEGKRVSRLIDFYVPYKTVPKINDMYLPPYEFCGRKDILHMGKSYTGSAYKWSKSSVPQDCWGINHWPMTFSGSVPKHLLQLRDYIEAKDLELPVTMIAVQYRRGGDGFFSLNYYFNPEMEGIPPPRQIEWRTSDWHRDRAFRDPQKKAYIEKLISWGETWYVQVDRGLKGLLKRGGP